MPVHVVCKFCDAEYNLKDEFAGQTLACPECNAHVENSPHRVKTDQLLK